MGNFDKSFGLDAGMTLTLPGGVFIVANAADIDRLRASTVVKGFGETAFVPLPPDAALPAEVVARARALVLEVDPSDRASLRRLSQLRTERGDLPIIAAIQDANVALVRTLVREGIADIAVLPFAAEELSSQILDATAKLAGRDVDHTLAPMVTVIRSAGGCGATTVVTHLAAALAGKSGKDRRVCVVDLDMQSGEVAPFVGKSPKVTIASVLEAGDRLDAEMLRGALTDSGHGFSIIAAPDMITPLESVNVDQLLKLLSLVRKSFDIVLVDLPADWTNWALSVAAESSELLLITDLSIASLRQAKRRLGLLSSVGVKKEKIGVVVNRVERHMFKTIGVDQVRDALKCDVLTTLAAEGVAMSAAQDEGLLISDVSRRSKFAADIHSLAQQLVSKGE